MTLRAQCHACAESFDLARLYAADPADADRCPNCSAHLGSAGLGHTTFRVDRHLKALREALRSLADNPGAFTIDSSGVRSRVLEAIDELDQPPPLHLSTRTAAGARH